MKRSIITVTTILLALLFVSSTTASAQRTSRGQFLFSGDVSTFMFESIGGEITVGRYMKYSYWNAGVLNENPWVPINGTGEKAMFARYEAMGSFMYRIIPTHTRVFNVYGGGEVFVGGEVLDPYAQLTEETYRTLLNSGYRTARFIYGGAIRLELEVFPFRSWAIYVPIRASLTANTAINGMFGGSVGLGIRFNY